MIRLQSLTVIVTQWCNLSCAHCGFASDPQRPRTAIDPELAREAISEAERRGARVIAFTGGEPFGFPHVLKDLITYAGSLGIPSEIASNCFWARSEQAATSLLAPLVRAGLRQLVVGYDGYHNRYFRRPVVRNATHAALALGLKVQVRVTSASGSPVARHRVACELELPEEAFMGTRAGFRVISRRVRPVGRGASAKIETPRPVSRENRGRCRSALRHPALGPDGTLFPCCSFSAVAGGELFGLNSSSRAEEGRVGRSFDELERNLLLRMISVVGSVRILELSGAAEIPCDMNPCEACMHIGCDFDTAQRVSSWLDGITHEAVSWRAS